MLPLHKTLVFICTLFIAPTVGAQVWERIMDLPAAEFTALEVIDGSLYAASGNDLYISSDSGGTWTHSLITPQENIWISCFRKFNGRIYAGTSSGIFSASSHAGIWSRDLQTEQVNSFTEKDGVLYASTEVFGVLKYNGAGWVPFNAGLPSYSRSVTEILDTPAGLLAIAGANGTFYRYNFTQSVWIEDYYSDSGFMAGIDVDDIINVGDTLYVSRYNSIYRSDDLGENWVEDKQGLLSGQTRLLYLSGDTLYSLSMIGSSLTRINRRDKDAAGAGWAEDAAMAPLTYAARELGGVLFLATSQGLYIPSETLGTPKAVDRAPAIYPNPSDGRFNIAGDAPIHCIRVFNLAGKLVATFQEADGIRSFALPEAGAYLLSVQSGSAVTAHKVIVK